MDDTAKLVAIVLLASFAIERIVAAVSYVLETARLYKLDEEHTAKIRAKQKRKLALLSLAALLAAAVVGVADLRILKTLNLGQTPLQFDYAISWLILFAGADRIRDFLQGAGGGGESEQSEVPAFRIRIDDGGEFREINRAS